MYYTHDNGGRPFEVQIKDHSVSVFPQIGYDEKQEKIQYAKKPIVTYEAEKIFIGTDPTLLHLPPDRMGSDPEGNSILLQMNPTRYIHIGTSIVSFDSLSPIVLFDSPIGPNDVVYPWAQDADGNVYLIIENVIVKNVGKNRAFVRKLNPKSIHSEPESVGPYRWFYDHSLMTSDEGRVPPQKPIVKTGIKSYEFKGQKWTLTFEPFPGKSGRLSDKQEYVTIGYEDGRKEKLNQKEFADLIADFGNKMGFVPLKTKTLIPRDLRGTLLGEWMVATSKARGRSASRGKSQGQSRVRSTSRGKSRGRTVSRGKTFGVKQ